MYECILLLCLQWNQEPDEDNTYNGDSNEIKQKAQVNYFDLLQVC